MAIKITDECINCDACVSECPNNAIYEPDSEWAYADETALDGKITLPSNGEIVDAEDMNEPLSDEFYFIVTDKCTECKGFHDEPQCASVCPVDCCVPDEDHVESEEELLKKKEWLHDE
ncbi:MAG TPA: 4Fe-4S dicluster domain-containing protein [Flavobacteriaceae bacterium]|nr:4Fe-4S dicluster domain-containing protein [Flavobacteriaceae bacterium]